MKITDIAGESVLKYLEDNGYGTDELSKCYLDLLERFQVFLGIKDYISKIDIDLNLIKKATIDFIIDEIRIKKFHSISNINTEKMYGYKAYWLLKRKPIIVTKEFDGCYFINEIFVSSFILSHMTREKGLSANACKTKDAFDEFQKLLMYNLKYRVVTQQSLELMIRAFYFGSDFLNTASNKTLEQGSAEGQ